MLDALGLTITFLLQITFGVSAKNYEKLIDSKQCYCNNKKGDILLGHSVYLMMNISGIPQSTLYSYIGLLLAYCSLGLLKGNTAVAT